MTVLVFDGRIGRADPVCAARNDDRDLAGKIDKTFEDAALPAHSAPSVPGLDVRGQSHLTLAVIAQAHRFQHRGVPEIAHGAEQYGRVGDFAVGGSLDTDRAKEVLLTQAVLRDFENFGPRQHRCEGRDPSNCLRGNIFEFEGRDIYGAGKPFERLSVGEFGNGGRAANLRGRAVGLVGENMAAVSEPRGGQRRHPTELAAA